MVAQAPRTLRAPTLRLQWRAALWSGGVRLALWVLPFATTRRLVEHAGGDRSRLACSRHAPATILAAVRASDRWVPRVDCLVRSMAAQILLQQGGWPSELHLGASRGGPDGLAAHAWVEVPGFTLDGEGPEVHQPLGAIPSSAARQPARAPRGSAPSTRRVV